MFTEKPGISIPPPKKTRRTHAIAKRDRIAGMVKKRIKMPLAGGGLHDNNNRGTLIDYDNNFDCFVCSGGVCMSDYGNQSGFFIAVFYYVIPGHIPLAVENCQMTIC